MKHLQSLNKETVLQRYRPIAPKTHKGIQGHALIIGGSYGKIGAVVLASKAALKTGCGLVTALIPQCGYEILQTANPEVMVITDDFMEHLTDIHFDLKPQAIGIGIGMGQHTDTQHAFYNFLKNNSLPLVVDADALNSLALNPEWLSLLPQKTILTPHLKELERLIGPWNSEDEKLEKVSALSLQYHCIIVVKGAPTLIVDNENRYQNTTGNPALATAGSGDVLTGMITSLLAQSYEPVDAAILGVYLHGLTADLALPTTGYQSFIASDCIDWIGKAYLSLEAL